MYCCPYCGSRLEKKIDHIPLSHKRGDVLRYIVDAGPKGIKKDKLKERFFAASESEVIIRTTIYHINQVIAPMKIITRGGVIRLQPN